MLAYEEALLYFSFQLCLVHPVIEPGAQLWIAMTKGGHSDAFAFSHSGAACHPLHGVGLAFLLSLRHPLVIDSNVLMLWRSLIKHPLGASEILDRLPERCGCCLDGRKQHGYGFLK